MIRASFRATVRDGLLVWSEPARAAAWLAMAKDKPLLVTLEREPHRRTLAQNRRYWSALVPFAAEVFQQRTGQPFSKDTAHYALKLAFLGHIEVPGPGGQIVLVPKSSAELDTAGFAGYCNRIEAWIEQEFHVKPELIQAEEDIA